MDGSSLPQRVIAMAVREICTLRIILDVSINQWLCKAPGGAVGVDGTFALLRNRHFVQSEILHFPTVKFIRL